MTNTKTALIGCLFLTIMIFSTCHKEAIWMDEAEITGYDYRKCSCCGGLFMKINGEIHSFDGIPEGSNLIITSETIFPVSVNVNWHDFEGACSDMRIVVDALEEI